MKMSKQHDFNCIEISKQALNRLKKNEQLFFLQLTGFYPGLRNLDTILEAAEDAIMDDRFGVEVARTHALVMLRFAVDYLHRGWLMLTNEFSDPQFLNMVRRGIPGTARKDLLHLQKFFSNSENTINQLLRKFPFDSKSAAARLRTDVLKDNNSFIGVYILPGEDIFETSGPVYHTPCFDSEDGYETNPFSACISTALQVKEWLINVSVECMKLSLRRMNCSAEVSLNDDVS